MTPMATLALAMGLCVDALAAAISKGAPLDRLRFGEALRTCLAFGAMA